MKQKILDRIELSPDEAAYLFGLLQDHLEYYRTLAGSAKCSSRNREFHHMVSNLAAKLLTVVRK